MSIIWLEKYRYNWRAFLGFLHWLVMFLWPSSLSLSHMVFPVLGSSSWPLSWPFQPAHFSFAYLIILNNVESHSDPWGTPLLTGCQLGKDLKVLRVNVESKLWSVFLSDSGKKVDFIFRTSEYPILGGQECLVQKIVKNHALIILFQRIF